MLDFKQKISREVWNETYKWETENIWDDSALRIAKDNSKAEEKSIAQFWSDNFQSILSPMRYIPGGRIISNAGLKLKGTTYINCYVGGFSGKNQDSIDGIYRALADQARTLKSEGGYGFCIDVIRPRGFYIEGIANYSPGPIEIAKLWNTSSAVITSGANIKIENKKGKKKIRKGAQMITMSIWHPSIEEFITAKQTPGVLDKFNMSVLITNEFIEAVKKNKKWDLIFPDTRFEKYDDEWNGNIVEWQAKDYPVVIVKTFENANTLWDLIMTSTYNRNEPGVIFIDRVNELNNLFYSEYIDATNPCVAAGTLVNTPVGYRKVEDIKPGEIISTLHPDGFEPVNDIEVHKNYPVYKVKFSDGSEQRVTAAHKYHAVKKGSEQKSTQRYRLDELVIGDYVQVHPSRIRGKVDRNSQQFKKAFIAGIVIGDGCYTENSKTSFKVASDKRDIEYNNSLKSVFNSFGIESFADDESKISNSVNLMFKLDSNLEKTGVVPGYSHTKVIPQEYLQDINHAAGILEGLFITDGDVNLSSNHPAIRFKTTSPELAKQIRLLLLNLGIHGRVTHNFADDGGIIQDRKIERKHIIYTVNVSGASVRELANIFYGSIHTKKNEKLKTVIFNNLCTGNTFKAQITSIEPDGNADVYDLHCIESDTWITEGYVQQGCGEQPLSKNSSCNLGSFNLVKYINADKTDWDYDLLRRDIPIAVRFQDNINDLTNFPLKEQKELAQKNRRVGIGYMGYGSALYMMKLPYGSKKALKLTEQLCKFVTNEIYRASAYLAKEKGKFPGFTKEYLESKFIALLDTDVRELIAKYGVRCSHHTMIAPTGNTGILAENVSGGLEPVVSPEYTRTIIVNEPIDGLDVPMDTDWDTQKFTNNASEWAWTKEGDEHILKTKFNGTTYKIDRNRGLTREERVMDYAVMEMGSDFSADADYVKTIFNLGVQEHIDTMAIFAKWIDAGISKTINLPNDYSYEDFKTIYMEAYDSKFIKGFTTYRIGTMTSVLSVDTKPDNKQDDEEFRITTATKRPKSLDADIFKVTVSGEKWIVFVSRIKDRPYEIFAGKISLVDIPSSIKDGKIVKTGKGHYEFEHAGEVIISDITKVFANDIYDSITRLVSTSLRHGTEVKFIVEQLNKAKGIVTDFSKCLARALKHYIKDGEAQNEKCPSCGKQTLVFQQGCTTCTDCGYSRCG